jgi:hypothetical protein
MEDYVDIEKERKKRKQEEERAPLVMTLMSHLR